MGAPTAVPDSSTFDTEIKGSSLPVLVDFWATWCGPCRLISPIVEQIASEQADKLRVLKVDVDEADNAQIAARFNVQSIPTLILFKDGQPVERLLGYMPKASLLSKLQKHL